MNTISARVLLLHCEIIQLFIVKSHHNVNKSKLNPIQVNAMKTMTMMKK